VSILLVAVAAGAGYVAGRLAVELFADQLDRNAVQVVGLVVGGLFASTVLRMRRRGLAGRQSHRIGRQRERLTATALERLPDSYQVLHDLPMPGAKANIDHVVVGPAGLFTIETRSYKRGVVVKGGKAYGNGHKLDKVVKRATAQAEAVTALTGTTTNPMVCVHGRGVAQESWREKPEVDGVRFVSVGRIARTIMDKDAFLTPETVCEHATTLQRVRRST
jgi:hypothetical protein